MRHAFLILASALVALGVTACGGSGTGTSNGSGGLGSGVAVTRAPFRVLDLSTGQAIAMATLDDVDTNPLYRTTRMAFRRVDVPVGQIGSTSGAVGAVLDPAATAAVVAPFYCAVFETTQAQWQAMAGTSSPWSALVSAEGSDDVRVGAQYPAIGIDLGLAQGAIQSLQAATGVTLALPSDEQWELACRGSGTGLYAWGDQRAPAASRAVVWETAGDVRGARPVGGLLPNSLGLYDIHGNVWELTSASHLRGGSWNDPLVTGRAAHRADIDAATRHLLVGVRFVMLP